MQKWFNNLSTILSIFTSLIFIIIGVYLFYLRYTNQIGFGYFIGIGIIVETTILNYKKHYGDNKLDNDEEE
tara:strand:- start:3501 stop:3713 length:213 start_codon:yes stop_codon:yes gene_type:complete